ncbi:MAG: cadmium-translocating P-type ATPase [Clostridia bacterium]|nr:cadmium-translocating P-type ATPase [Clostridia bacterium]
MKEILHIENLDCPVCAEALQEDLQKIKGVRSVQVDYVSQTITLDAENEKAIAKVVDVANHFEEVRVLEGGRYALTDNSHKKEWIRIGISALVLTLGLVFEHVTGLAFGQMIAYVFYAIAYLVVGWPILISTFENVKKGRIFDENFLMTIASFGAIAIGEAGEAVLVMLLYTLGELLQSIAVGSSRRSVTELMALKSEKATRLRQGQEEEIAPENVEVGDLLVVKSGEKIPVDGILCSERAVLDTKSLTGEAEPRTFDEGAEILAGYINVGGRYEMKAIRPYKESAVQKILDMVENASQGKAKPEKFITKFARVYTPVVCILALLIAILGPFADGLLTEGLFYFKDWARWLQSALTFLVISCPCALIISVPLTYFSGIGICAKQGILVKGGTYLDILAQARAVAFDKTGTLTEGNFTVSAVHPVENVSEQALLSMVASLERGSAHPIARAFEGIETGHVFDEITEIPGQGLIGRRQDEEWLVGNDKLFAGKGIAFTKRESVATLVYIAKNGEYLGCVEIGDRIRAEAKKAVSALKNMGISQLVMLTGDGRERAEKIANEVGMSAVSANLLPEDKLKEAEKLKQNGVLIYVGDGINDAPVMATADCAVSMGKLGSAAAMEASDLVLISDDLSALPKALRIARKTRSIVLQNIIFSLVMKVGFMALGVAGVLPLWLAVFADVGVMLLAVLNSFRVRFLK